MSEVLTRNFIVNIDLNEYLKVLKNKIQYMNNKPKENEIESLFSVLKLYENNEPQYYAELMAKLQNFTEDFVIRNSSYIKWLIQLEKEERQIILLKFNDFNYNDDLNVIDLINTIENRFEESITNYIEEHIFNKNYSNEELMEISLNFKNRENKQFIGIILDNFLNLYPAISDYAIFSQLFLELNKKIGLIASQYIQNKIIFDDREIRKYYNLSIQTNKLKKIKKTISNQRKLK